VTLNSDTARHQQDIPTKFAGPGVILTFGCPACGKSKLILGRRMRVFQGLRQYLCACCVKARQK
jgi:hypothetical protein